jgi:hypothetical protein
MSRWSAIFTTANTPTTRDFHEVLARPDIQAVLVAAGKDVYCEKPGVQDPLSAVASGGIYKWKGDRDVPDIHSAYKLAVSRWRT